MKTKTKTSNKSKFFIIAVILIFSGVLFFSNLANAQITNPGASECPDSFEKEAGVCFPTETGLSEAPVIDIMANFLSWVLGIFGFIAIIAFVISGIQYLTSAGDEKMIETAKRNMRWSVIGVIVGISGLVIIWAITEALDASTPYF
ncbi:hypothetical protein BMS3Abin15_00900 [bacterium BMS3Abin15]|nr:hypothetical protein BMS3Abin15_00900 [bacterium BMS3Abin15]HDH07589.1 hypothetical protein [Candidatus Moranbacteria bacterium]HDZ85453.1 hypothetical protein [Candidatus Moranbacteria bacterium]